MKINIYSDESGYLPYEHTSTMVIGTIECPAAESARISKNLRAIKTRYGLLSKEDLQKRRRMQFEAKWVKISEGRRDFYEDFVRYFFNEPSLRFRAVVIHKSDFPYNEWSHGEQDKWHNEIYMELLQPFIDRSNCHCIFLDIRGTKGNWNNWNKRRQLKKELREKNDDVHAKKVIKRIQYTCSHDSEIMQMTDILIGAICYQQRLQNEVEARRALMTSEAKQRIISLIDQLNEKTPRMDVRFWKPEEGVQ